MGSGTTYYCSKCDKDYDILWGYGFSKFKPYHLYKCNKCDYWENKTVEHFIKMESENCPNCNKSMKIITERNLDKLQLQCPKCQSTLEWDGCFYSWD